MPEGLRLPSTAISEAPTTDNRPRPLLAVVLAAQFMALLDVFIVNVAAPTIGSEPDASGADLQLVIAGHAITYSVLLITGARLGERLGRRGKGEGTRRGVSLFTVPLVLGQEEDRPLWSRLSLAAAAVVFGLFCAYESRLARRGALR